MKFLPCGESAVLVELASAAERRALVRSVQAQPVSRVVEAVPAAQTVLLRVASAPDIRAVIEDVQARDLSGIDFADAASGPVVTVPVKYDGADLADVADLLGIDTNEVVRRHSEQEWTVEFVGFLAGFGYLAGSEGGLTVPRRTNPRTRIPAGSVGLAGDWSGIYPSSSPGGWQLIGTTDLRMFDPSREPVSLLAPGTRVRFQPC